MLRIEKFFPWDEFSNAAKYRQIRRFHGKLLEVRYLVNLNEMHFRNQRSGRIGLLHPLGCYFIPREVKNSSLGPSALGMNFFFPWDEIHPSGCKTQFFLSAGYEIPQFYFRK